MILLTGYLGAGKTSLLNHLLRHPDARIGVVVMAVLLVVYVALVGQRAVLLLLSGDPVGIAMGVALIVLPILAIWGLGRELWFGVRAEQLARRLETRGAAVTVRAGSAATVVGGSRHPRPRADRLRHARLLGRGCGRPRARRMPGSAPRRARSCALNSVLCPESWR